VINVFVHERGETRCVERVEPEWLDPASTATVWVDLAAPTPEELSVLADVFRFHPLSVDDARSSLQFPKVEPYPSYLYVVLHGIDVATGKTQFATRDVDFFLGRNYLVTVHDGRSRTIEALRDVCHRHPRVLEHGPVALLHRLVDSMVDNYRPVIEAIEDRISTLEEHAYSGREHLGRQLMKLKRELSTMRRVLVPQRDAIGRLARREFEAINDEMAFRFRDVYDHVVRMTEEAVLFHERVTGIFELNLTTISNRLNQVMKVLTVMSTIFLPLTVLTGMWGMNIMLPHFPGPDWAQFWWVAGVMGAMSGSMLAFFRYRGWL
jgi:magnesium transporter